MTGARHVPNASTAVIRLGGARMRVVLSDEAAGFSLFEETTEPGSGPPLHLHRDEDEFFRVIEGHYLFRAGEATVEAAPGDTLFVPRGLPHCFWNAGESTGRLFMGFQPGGPERFFPAFAEAGLSLPGDMERVAELAAGYGIEFVGPNPFAPG